MTDALVEVRDLVKHFPITRGIIFQRHIGAVHAVDGVSFDVLRGETLGLVGETGCGKSTTARVVMRLLEPTSGTIRFDGRDISHIKGRHLKPLRREMQLIFQDPYSSLNPRLKVGATIAEPAVVHRIVSKEDAPAHVERLLSLVGLPPALADRYPRQLSGGQRQRVAIARALSLQPEFLIADEPVSALDVSIQAQILNLLDDLLQSLHLTTVFIAHQLSVVRHISDRVAIMYLGRIVESGPTAAVFDRPQHPYTAGLLEAAPRPDPSVRRRRPAMRGDIPSPLRIPSGCRFRTRCAFAEDRCAVEDPLLAEMHPGHSVACHVLPFRDTGPPR
jgi:oligopeptide transport system ATP-binding protein